MQATYNISFLRLVFCFLAIAFCSCRTYNQNIMFKTTGSINTDKLRQSLINVERNYVIQPNDYLDVRVYTNKGERIFDPNGELPFGAPGGGLNNTGTTRTRSNNGGQQASNTEFLVQYDGTIKLPMVGSVKVSGYTLLQADSLLQPLFNEYYEDSFVRTTVTNNRVFILGAIGGQGGSGGQVITMLNDNMNIIEVIAQAGGMSANASVQNIKIIRDYMNHDPIVQIVDLSTIEGMRQASLNVEPNDIIYIEPNNRIFITAFRDVAPVVTTILSVAATVISTIILVNRL